MFFSLDRKVRSLKKYMFDLTKPEKMGDNILILATSPNAAKYFEYESVREQFQGYDLMMVNFMVMYSQEELFLYQPKYLCLVDPIFYDEKYKLPDSDMSYAEKVASILEKITWECYIITPVLAEFKVDNANIKYIRLSVFSTHYKWWNKNLVKHNLCTLGMNNVIMAAWYFAITFGYKKIAVLGCEYKHPEVVFTPEGMQSYEYLHYYDKGDRKINFYPYEELDKAKISHFTKVHQRAARNCQTLWDLKQYSCDQGAETINYSEGHMLESMHTGLLNLEKRD